MIVTLKQLAQDGAVSGRLLTWNATAGKWEPSTLWYQDPPNAGSSGLYSVVTKHAVYAAGTVTSGAGKITTLAGGGTTAASQAGGDAVLDGGFPGAGGAAGYAVCNSNGMATLPKNSRIIHPMLNTLATDLTTSYTAKGQVIIVDPSEWPPAKRVVNFFAAAKAASAAADDVIWVKLYNVTTAADVASSEIFSGSTTWTLFGAAVTLAADANAYRVYAKVAGPTPTGSNLGSCELRVTYD